MSGSDSDFGPMATSTQMPAAAPKKAKLSAHLKLLQSASKTHKNNILMQQMQQPSNFREMVNTHSPTHSAPLKGILKKATPMVSTLNVAGHESANSEGEQLKVNSKIKVLKKRRRDGASDSERSKIKKEEPQNEDPGNIDELALIQNQLKELLAQRDALVAKKKKLKAESSSDASDSGNGTEQVSLKKSKPSRLRQKASADHSSDSGEDVKPTPAELKSKIQRPLSRLSTMKSESTTSSSDEDLPSGQANKSTNRKAKPIEQDDQSTDSDEEIAKKRTRAKANVDSSASESELDDKGSKSDKTKPSKVKAASKNISTKDASDSSDSEDTVIDKKPAQTKTVTDKDRSDSSDSDETTEISPTETKTASKKRAKIKATSKITSNDEDHDSSDSDRTIIDRKPVQTSKTPPARPLSRLSTMKSESSTSTSDEDLPSDQPNKVNDKSINRKAKPIDQDDQSADSDESTVDQEFAKKLTRAKAKVDSSAGESRLYDKSSKSDKTKPTKVKGTSKNISTKDASDSSDSDNTVIDKKPAQTKTVTGKDRSDSSDSDETTDKYPAKTKTASKKIPSKSYNDSGKKHAKIKVTSKITSNEEDHDSSDSDRTIIDGKPVQTSKTPPAELKSKIQRPLSWLSTMKSRSSTSSSDEDLSSGQANKVNDKSTNRKAKPNERDDQSADSDESIVNQEFAKKHTRAKANVDSSATESELDDNGSKSDKTKPSKVKPASKNISTKDASDSSDSDDAVIDKKPAQTKTVTDKDRSDSSDSDETTEKSPPKTKTASKIVPSKNYNDSGKKNAKIKITSKITSNEEDHDSSDSDRTVIDGKPVRTSKTPSNNDDNDSSDSDKTVVDRKSKSGSAMYDKSSSSESDDDSTPAITKAAPISNKIIRESCIKDKNNSVVKKAVTADNKMMQEQRANVNKEKISSDSGSDDTSSTSSSTSEDEETTIQWNRHTETDSDSEDESPTDVFDKITANSDFKTLKLTQSIDLQSEIGVDDEIFLMKVTKGVDPKLLLNQTIDFSKNKSSLKMDNGVFKVAVDTESQSSLCILTRDDDKYVVKSLETVGSVTITQEYKMPNENKLTYEINNCTVPYPKNLKTRHPLFGGDYENKIAINENIVEKLNNPIKVKKVTTKKVKVEPKAVEEDIFNILNSHETSRKRKRPESVIENAESAKKKRRLQETNDFENILNSMKKEITDSTKKKSKKGFSLDEVSEAIFKELQTSFEPATLKGVDNDALEKIAQRIEKLPTTCSKRKLDLVETPSIPKKKKRKSKDVDREIINLPTESILLSPSKIKKEPKDDAKKKKRRSSIAVLTNDSEITKDDVPIKKKRKKFVEDNLKSTYLVDPRLQIANSTMLSPSVGKAVFNAEQSGIEEPSKKKKHKKDKKNTIDEEFLKSFMADMEKETRKK